MRPPARLPLELLSRVRAGAPVPLPVVETLRRLSWGTDPLSPVSRPSPGSRVEHPVLADALRDVSLGTWTVGPETIRYLRNVVESARPRLVIEFGSGVSTLCLAQFLADVAGTPPGRVVSIEQSADEADRTRERLARLGLDRHVDVLTAPLRMREVEGRYLNAYDLSPEALEALVGDDRADLVLVDGPAAESGARYGTIPLIRSYVRPGAVFLLDDALRDGELSVAAGWSRLGYLRIDGIVPVGHGLLRGTFVDQTR